MNLKQVNKILNTTSFVQSQVNWIKIAIIFISLLLLVIFGLLPYKIQDAKDKDLARKLNLAMTTKPTSPYDEVVISINENGKGPSPKKYISQIPYKDLILTIPPTLIPTPTLVPIVPKIEDSYLDLYGINIYLPDGYTIKEIDRHPENTDYYGLYKCKHDEANYSINDQNNYINAYISLYCEHPADHGGVTTGLDEITVLDKDKKIGRHYIKHSNPIYNGISYFIFYVDTDTNRAFMGSFRIKSTIHKDLYASVYVKYTGPIQEEVTYLQQLDKIVLSIIE